VETFWWVLGWWIVLTVLAFLWKILWFLLGGWVVTLAQVAVVVLLVFGYKYGWAAAPGIVAEKLSRLFQWGWAWVRKREVPPQAAPSETRRTARMATPGRRRRRQLGDVNLSSLLNGLLVGVLMLWTAALS
jgi:hypothetical protein